MANVLSHLGASRGYWLGLLALGLLFGATALYFQYALDYRPCVLCIHARILVIGLMLVALFGLTVRNTVIGRVVGQLLSVLVFAALAQRAYLLLGIERGFVQGECGVDSALPSWMPLDRWFPVMFQVREPCGYTPTMPMGFTMAELLLVLSIALALVSIGVLAATLVSLGSDRQS